MPLLHRRDQGQPIRDAMKAAGLSGPSVAEATKTLDPDGKGISAAKVGQLAGRGKTAKERCRPRTAELIAEVLNQPLDDLFVTPSPSTSTLERSTPT